MLLILVKADGVLWFYSGFAVPSILMAGVAVPLWASQRCGLSCHRIRVIQWYVSFIYYTATYIQTALGRLLAFEDLKDNCWRGDSILFFSREACL